MMTRVRWFATTIVVLVLLLGVRAIAHDPYEALTKQGWRILGVIVAPPAPLASQPEPFPDPLKTPPVLLRPLTVTRSGSGIGTVTGTGIDCGADCSHSYSHGQTVTLSASPNSGSTFTGWSGPCSGTGTCVVTMTAAATVTATFGVVAGGAPNPLLLPVATTAQRPLTATYITRNVPSLAAGGSYLDPHTNIKIYKLTSGAFPISGGGSWGHTYSEGGDEVSLPHTGTTRTIKLEGSSHRLIDFTPGVVSNPRSMSPGPCQRGVFTFSSNPQTPYYAYWATDGCTVIRRFDVRTMTEVPGNGWPVTGESGVIWLHQSENDGLFTWMRGTCTGCPIVGFQPGATPVKKTITDGSANEPRIDRAGRYIYIDRGNGAGAVWDWQANTIDWSLATGQYISHTGSLRRRWYAHNAFAGGLAYIARIDPEIPNTYTNTGVPGVSARSAYGNGNWVQSTVPLADQWVLFSSVSAGTTMLNDSSGFYAPGGMVFIRETGAERRLLAYPYNTAVQPAEEQWITFAKSSSDGHYVLFTSNMAAGTGLSGAPASGSRSDVFLAEMPR